MAAFEIIDRPPKNRRRLADKMEWDAGLEDALLFTREDGGAVKVPLWKFHSSPAKGRLWKRGFKVKHRLLADRQTVAAWVEAEAA